MGTNDETGYERTYLLLHTLFEHIERAFEADGTKCLLKQWTEGAVAQGNQQTFEGDAIEIAGIVLVYAVPGSEYFFVEHRLNGKPVLTQYSYNTSLPDVLSHIQKLISDHDGRIVESLLKKIP